MSMNDCEANRADIRGSKVRVFVLQTLKDKKPRRRAGHGGRKGWRPDSAEKERD